MEAAIFSQAIREYFRPKRFLPWVFIGVLCMMMAAYWSVVQHDASSADSYANIGSIFVFHIVALASAIYTTAIVSQEIEQKTIVYLLTRPVPRWKLLVVRYLASVIVVSAVGIVCAVLTSIGAYHSLGGNPLLVNDCLALIVGAFAYGGLFLLITLLFNRAMIICLLFAFGWESMVPNMPGQMYYLSINSYMQGIAQHPSAGSNKLLSLVTSSNGDNTLTASTSYTVMFLFAAVLIGFASMWFSSFEFLPREDAE